MTDPTATLDAVPPASDGDRPESPLRWRLAHRPDLRFGHATGGVAGILVAAAVVAFVVAVTGDDTTLPGVGFTVALIAAALAAGWRVRGPLRSAAVSAIVLAVPLVWLFAIVGDGEGGNRSDIRLILLLSVASYVVLYLLTWTRGRAVLLGLALLLGASWIVFEVADQEVPFANVAEQTQSRGFDSPAPTFGGDDRTTEAAVAATVVAIALLGAGVVLDRRGRAGAATPCLLVGALFAVNGAFTFAADVDDGYAAGIIVGLAGLAIGLAGSLGRRRGTSWIGAFVLLGGAVTVIAQGTQDTATSTDATAVRFGLYALLGAAVLLTVGILVATRLAEPVDGGEPGPPPPPPPPPPPVPVAPEPIPSLSEPAVVPAVDASPPIASPPSPTDEPAWAPPPPVTWAAPEPTPPTPPAPEPPEPLEPPEGPPAEEP